MESRADKEICLTPEEFALQTARPETRAVLALIVLLILGVIVGVSSTWNFRTAALIVGSIVAFGGMWAFASDLQAAASPGQAAGSAAAGWFFGHVSREYRRMLARGEFDAQGKEGL